MAPLVEQIHERYERYPKDVLVDGGFVSTITSTPSVRRRKTARSMARCGSPKMPARIAMHRGPRIARRWLPGGSGWRVPKRTRSTRSARRRRSGVNALARNRGLRQLLVRGVAKVKAIARGYAIAHNLLRAVSLRAALATHA